MKTFALLLLVWLPLLALADDITEYKASNGITYHIGDTLKLGKGTGGNGNFMSLRVGGFNAFMVLSHSHSGNNDERLGVDKSYNHTTAKIKRIKKESVHGTDRYYFVVTFPHSPGSYNLYIDEAIENCEVAQCNNTNAMTRQTPDKYDELKKLKELLDNGTLTKEEFEAQKKKLLEQ